MDMGSRILIAAFTLLAAACAPAPPLSPVTPSVAPASQFPTASASTSPSAAAATLIVTQAFVGEGFYTEGAYAYVELFDASGALLQRAETTEYRLEQELARFTVAAGRYDVRSYVRSCEAACPLLDAPTAACTATIDLKHADEVAVRIERTLRSCEMQSL